MKNIILATLTSLMVGSFFTPIAQSATVERELHLNYNHQEIGGYRGATLQDEIQDSYPWLDVSALELKSVVVVAKSRYGNSQVMLEINGFRAMPRNIPPAFGDDYLWPDPSSYHSVEVQNPLRIGGNGPWHLNLGPGPLKLFEITVNVIDHNPIPEPDPRAPLTYAHSAELRAGTNGRVTSVPVGLNRVKELAVVGTHQAVEIRGFRVYFADRRIEEISALHGLLLEGETHKVILPDLWGRGVRGVDVIALSPDTNTEPGKFMIQAGYYR